MSQRAEELKTVLQSFLSACLIDRNQEKAKTFLSDSFKGALPKYENITSVKQIRIGDFRLLCCSENRSAAVGNAEISGEQADNSPTVLALLGISYILQDDRRLIDDLQIATYYDYSESNRAVAAETALLKKNMPNFPMLCLLQDGMHGGTMAIADDRQRTLLLASEELIRYLGYTPAEFDHASQGCYGNLIDPRDLDFVNNSVAFQLQNGKQYEVEYRLRKADHSYARVKEKGYRQDNGSGSLFGLVCDNTDATRGGQQARRRENIVTAELPDSRMLVHDCTLSALPDYSSLSFSDKTNALLQESFLECLERKCSVEREFCAVEKDGNPKECRMEQIPFCDDSGNVTLVLSKLTALDNEKTASAALQDLTERDGWTGLYTKEKLGRLIEEELQNSGENELAAFLLVDIDRFGAINERLSVTFGDTILKSIALRLRDFAEKQRGYVGRIAGDRFALFLKTASMSEVSDTADRIGKAIRELYVGELSELQLTCSIGIVDCRKWCTDFEDMLFKATQALYRSKTMGKNMIVFYNGQAVDSEQERLFIEARLAQALSPTAEESFTDKLSNWETRLLATTKDFDSAMKLLLFCLQRYFKLSCLCVKEVFSDSKCAKISYLVPDGSFEENFAYHELYPYEREQWKDPIPEHRYCKLTDDFQSASYYAKLEEFEDGKKDIAAEYPVVNQNELIGSIAAVRKSSRVFWNQTEIIALQRTAELLSPYLRKKQSAAKSMRKYEEIDSEISGVCSLSVFLERVSRLLQANPESKFAIICSNLGGYYELVERHGFLAGKEALQIFADLLRSGAINRKLCIAHISDDRFVSVLSVTDLETLKDYISRNNHKIVKVFLEKYSDLNLYVNTGICELQRTENGILKAIQNADIARKSAKGQMQNSCRIFDDRLRLRLSLEKDLVDSLESALRLGEFEIQLQPIFHIADGEVVAAETVVQWKHGTYLLSREEYAPILERHGLMTKVELFVIQYALTVLRHWMKEHKRKIPISIRLSREHALDPNRAAYISDLCKQHGVAFSYLEFSFFENDFGSNPVPLRQLMSKLMKRGFRVTVDQFGFGESPLKHIISFSANSIKLSDEFLRYNSRVLYTNEIIRHFVSMIKEMGFGVICGGVKTQEQLELLQTIGCEQAQGSYYADAMTAEQFEERYLKDI